MCHVQYLYKKLQTILFSPTADMEDVLEDFSSNIKSLTQLTTFLLNTFMELHVSGGVDM